MRQRRLEIPGDMQKKFGVQPLGAADGPVKTAIFSGTNARLYNYKAPATWKKMDRFSALKEDYLNSGPVAPTCDTATSPANRPFPGLGPILSAWSCRRPM